MVRSAILSGTDPAWTEVLRSLPHDVYHTPEYHGVPGLGREGEAFAFCYFEEGKAFLWPYLRKEIPGSAGYFDVTSVYGYAGPVSSPDPGFQERAWKALEGAWQEQRVVAAFTRFHPILANHRCLQGEAANGLRRRGSTVSIDLTIPLEEQVRRYQKVHRQEIRRGRELGMVTTYDAEWAHGDDFVRLYRGAMARLNSRPEYLVDGEWLAEFRRRLGDRAGMFVTKYQDVVAVVSLVMIYPPYLHGHLIGSNPDLAVHSPTKVALDGERIWATQQGLTTHHVGGGLGGREDSLFQWKRKFSSVTHEFYVGNWILNPTVYHELAAEHRRQLSEQGVEAGESDYFPSYRYQPRPA